MLNVLYLHYSCVTWSSLTTATWFFKVKALKDLKQKSVLMGVVLAQGNL